MQLHYKVNMVDANDKELFPQALIYIKYTKTCNMLKSHVDVIFALYFRFRAPGRYPLACLLEQVRSTTEYSYYLIVRYS